MKELGDKWIDKYAIRVFFTKGELSLLSELAGNDKIMA
jgi:hypothetical protein